MLSEFKSPYPLVHIPKTSYYQYLVDHGSRAKFSPSTPAHVDGVTGETFTRSALEQGCLLWASAFRNVEQKGLLGLGRGSVVLVFSPNTILYPRIQFALAAAGICPAHANSAYLENELAHAFRISNASHVLVHPSLLNITFITLVSTLGYTDNDVKSRIILMAYKKDVPTGIRAQGWLDLDDIVEGVEPLDKPESFDGEQAHETAAIYFSSGTTGLSKAVALTHYSHVAFLVQSAASWPWYVHGRDVIMAVVPLYHVFGGVILTLHSYYVGCPLVILPRFEPKSFLSSIAKLRITVLPLAPPLLHFLLKHSLVDKYDLTTVRLLHVGAAPVPTDVILMTVEFFKQRGTDVGIIQGYGMTESNGGLAFLRVEHMLTKAGSVGFVMPNMEGRLVDDDGKVVTRGSPGELWVKGPNIMKYYVGNVKATQESLTLDGWLKTGDVMTLDEDGFLTIVDRKKELIKYKGFQVAPAELEAVLFTHPQIADAGVIGVYSEKDFSEVPRRAYIVPKDIALLQNSQSNKEHFIEGIHEWLKSKLAPYKLLRGGIAVVDSIPKSPSGKILRKDLRALHQRLQKARL
ncbi:AMP binding protein [Cytidiella melzeri]|nr:AMP binding protein [Cytidiella melzeri]